MNVTLVTVVGESIDILSHMLSHYRTLGVDSFIIHAHGQTCDDPKLISIRKTAADCGTEVTSMNIGPWFAGNNPLLYWLSRVQRPDDWFILADQDELHAYPDDLVDLIGFCDKKGYHFVEGCLIDRISNTGELITVNPLRPIWEQFPLGAMFSARVLGAVTNKIVAAKGFVTLANGQHHAYSGVGCPPSDVYIPVHHFKWVDGLPARLRSRVSSIETLYGSSFAMKDLYSRECSRFSSYYAMHWRIVPGEPRILAAPCNPNYPHWETIKAWRLAAPYFSADLARWETRTQVGIE